MTRENGPIRLHRLYNLYPGSADLKIRPLMRPFPYLEISPTTRYTTTGIAVDVASIIAAFRGICWKRKMHPRNMKRASGKARAAAPAARARIRAGTGRNGQSRAQVSKNA